MPALKHVMISYQWDSQKRMIKLRDNLKAEGYNVWMDINNMCGDTLSCMAEAVENAEVVIICVSKKYQDSRCCKIEAQYAFQKNKVIVPLKVEENFQPSGWLGLLMGTKLYYQAHNDEMLNKNFPDLIRELGDKGRTAQEDKWSPVKQEGSKALQCSVCLNRFKNPKMLPCLHRFCEECLVRLAPLGTKNISCPLCRKQSSVPKGDATQFPTDFHLKELVEEEASRHQLSGGENEFTCTCCDLGKQSRVVAKCQDCKHYICKSGLSAHKSFAGLQDHNLLILDGATDLETTEEKVETTSETTAKATPEKRRYKVNDWKIFDDMYDEDHSIHLLIFWIQQYDGDSKWQEMMVNHYLSCLTDLKESGNTSQELLAKRHQQVANVFKQAGQYEKAIELVEKALDLEVKELGGRPENLADLYYLVSDIYSEMLNSVAFVRNMDPAVVQKYIKHARNSLNLRRKLKGDDHKYKLAKILRSLAHALRNWVDYGGNSELIAADAKAEAKKHIDEAIKLFTKLKAKGNVSKCIMNKASLEEPGSEEKEKLFRKALAMCDETYGECSVLSGMLLWCMYVLYHTRKDFYEAFKWLDKCREIREQVHGEHHPQTQMVYEQLKRSIYVEIAKRTKESKEPEK